MKVCKFLDCGKLHKGKGYCSGHLYQLKNNNWDESELKPLFIPKVDCDFIDPNTGTKCNKPHKSMGYCNGHYTQLKKYNYDKNKLKPIFIPKTDCNFIDPNTGVKCNKSHSSSGYCHAHYEQLRKNNFNKFKLKPLQIFLYECKFIDPDTGIKCSKPHVSRGYCDSHYTQLKRSGYNESKLTLPWNKNDRDLYYEMVLENYPELKTKEEINRRHGLIGITHFRNPSFNDTHERWYITITYNNSNKHKNQHFSRHLMELKECKKLKSDGSEDVDHIDENKHNDYIDNLQILTNSENTIKSLKYKYGEINKIYKLICPICSNSFQQKAKVTDHIWERGSSGPTCSKECSHILINCKSLNNGEFKSTNDDIIGRFIEGIETEKDRRYTQPSDRDIERIWYFRMEINFNILKLKYKDNKTLSNSFLHLVHELSNLYKGRRLSSIIRKYLEFTKELSFKDKEELIFNYICKTDINLSKYICSYFRVIY